MSLGKQRRVKYSISRMEGGRYNGQARKLKKGLKKEQRRRDRLESQQTIRDQVEELD